MTAIPTDLPAQIDVPQRGLFPYAKYLAGAVGSGLTFVAACNTCATGSLFSRLPYNKSGELGLKDAKRRLVITRTAGESLIFFS